MRPQIPFLREAAAKEAPNSPGARIAIRGSGFVEEAFKRFRIVSLGVKNHFLENALLCIKQVYTTKLA